MAVGLISLASILLSWTGGAWGLSLGALGILGACFLWGLDNNFTRHISAKNPLVIVGVKGLGAGGLSLVLSFALGKTMPALEIVGLAMLVGAVSYGLSIQLFILALRSLGATRTGALFGIAPFVGTAISILIFREMPQSLFWAALPVMLLGAWLMLTENHQHQHAHEQLEHAHAHTHSHLDEHHAHEHQTGESLVNDRHAHVHRHAEFSHTHPHAPDLHHRHIHNAEEAA